MTNSMVWMGAPLIYHSIRAPIQPMRLYALLGYPCPPYPPCPLCLDVVGCKPIELNG